MISCSSAALAPIFSLLTLVAVNQKRDQDILCNKMREDSKGERGARPGLGAVYGLLELKVSGILESMIYSNMLLALTWCHCTPADTPTRPCPTAISTEHQVDDVAFASYGSRQGGADTLASNENIRRGGAAAFLHQGCPVAVRDCQVGVETGGKP